MKGGGFSRGIGDGRGVSSMLGSRSHGAFTTGLLGRGLGGQGGHGGGIEEIFYLHGGCEHQLPCKGVPVLQHQQCQP